jgi:tungstate transport system substrate-binding protein
MNGMHSYIASLLLLVALSSMPAAAQERLRLATTTSTENSGLLAVLNQPFEQRHGVRVDVIAVGSGKAMKLGENGDVDVILAHAPDLEEAYMAAGFGVERLPVMHNDFVLLGPPADPAGVSIASSSAAAMAAIAGSGAAFVSRGDASGTHQKELALWKAAGIEPSGPWYLSTGQGMGAVLQIAGDKLAYTLADRGTWLACSDRLDLRIVFENAPEMNNPYHVIAVNPAKHPHVKGELARRYADYIRSAEGQEIIRRFTSGGRPLFHPDVFP